MTYRLMVRSSSEPILAPRRVAASLADRGHSARSEASRGFAVQRAPVGVEAKRVEEAVDPIAGRRLLDVVPVAARLVVAPGKRERVGGDRLDMRDLSPFDPMLFGMFGARAMALVRLERFDEAGDWAVKAAARPNAFAHIQAIAACASPAVPLTNARL